MVRYPRDLATLRAEHNRSAKDEFIEAVGRGHDLCRGDDECGAPYDVILLIVQLYQSYPVGKRVAR
jgi:hypothetical protein